MRVIFRAFVFIIVILASVGASNAQSISNERLNNWEFRFYACKNVVFSAAVVARLMESNNITSLAEIDSLETTLGPALGNNVIENEKSFQFRGGEGAFISSVTFAIISGMVHAGIEITDMKLMRNAYDGCIHAIEGISQ